MFDFIMIIISFFWELFFPKRNKDGKINFESLTLRWFYFIVIISVIIFIYIKLN